MHGVSSVFLSADFDTFTVFLLVRFEPCGLTSSVLLADCLLLPVLRPTIFAITLALYRDDVMTAADSALRVLGRADFSFGGCDNSASIALASSSPGCVVREAGKLTSQALEGTVLAVNFSMMSLAAGTDTDTDGECHGVVGAPWIY